MSRMLLQYLLPLVLPTVLYMLWWYVFGRWAKTSDGTPSLIQQGPWFWLVLAGIALMAAGLVVTALMGGSDPGGTYVPPRLEDGRVVPGRVVH